MSWTLQDWAYLSSVVTAFIALVALAGAVWQVIVARQSQREATASALYGNYLALAVQYPRLAGAYPPVPEANEQADEEFERYEWFVSVMLHAFEQILDLTGNDRIWRQALSDQIAYHRNYLASQRFVPGHYSIALCELFPPRSAFMPTV